MSMHDIDLEFASAADYARLYREMGLQAVPALSPHVVKPGEQWKRPAVKWKDRETELVDQETFDDWFAPGGRFTASTNVGIITGECSGRLVVIDLDHQKNLGSQEWWNAYLEVHESGIEPETLTQRTGGGGLQLFFRWPASAELPGAHKTPIGVDIRGQGGFVVAAPSLHESGLRYEFIDLDIEIADAPPGLVQAVTELIEQYGHIPTQAAARPGSNVELLPQAPTTLLGEQLDGREQIMTELVWAAAIDFRRGHAFFPGQQASDAAMRAAYSRYEAKVSPRDKDASIPKSIRLDREGRGPGLFTQKWTRALQQWDQGLLEAAGRPPPGVSRETLGEPDLVSFDPADEREVTEEVGEFGEVTRYDAATGEVIGDPAVDLKVNTATEFDADQPRQLKSYDLAELMRMPRPEFLVDGVIIRGGLGFVVSEPGLGKSFVALDLGLTLAHALDSWCGFPTYGARSGCLYLAGEGVSGAKLRVMAWKQARAQFPAALPPFEMIFETLDFMHGDDVEAVLRSAEAYEAKHGAPPAVIVVDTVSRVLPGAEENLQKDMTLFVNACKRLQEATGAAVVGVHHVSKGSGSMRGSGVLQGAADFVLKLLPVEGEPEAGDTLADPRSPLAPPIVKEVDLVAEKIKDAADGWTRRLYLVETDCLDVGGSTSLTVELAGVATQAEEYEPPDLRGWPNKRTCAEILEDVRVAACKMEHYISAPNSMRWLGHRMAKEYRVGAEMARDMILTWLNNGTLIEGVVDKKSKRRGLTVGRNLGGHVAEQVARERYDARQVEAEGNPLGFTGDEVAEATQAEPAYSSYLPPERGGLMRGGDALLATLDAAYEAAFRPGTGDEVDAALATALKVLHEEGEAPAEAAEVTAEVAEVASAELPETDGNDNDSS